MTIKTLFFTAFLFALSSCAESSKEEINRLTKANQQLNDDLSIVTQTERINQEIFRRTVKYSEMSIENKKVYWGKDSLKTYSLKDLALKTRLFFCFSTNTCTPCIDESIRLIREAFPDYKDNEAIIITGDYPLRLRDSVYDKKMLTGITLPLEKIEAPFFFILDKKMEISHLHIYNKMNTDLTKIYLEEVKYKFCTDKNIIESNIQ
jgi:hypothetical protein